MSMNAELVQGNDERVTRSTPAVIHAAMHSDERIKSIRIVGRNLEFTKFTFTPDGGLHLTDGEHNCYVSKNDLISVTLEKQATN